MLLDNAVIGTAKTAIVLADLFSNGVPTALLGLLGQCYTFAQADEIGAPEDFASDAGPVTCVATAMSSGWFGTAIGAGFVFAPPPPPVIAPVITPAAAASGAGSASALAGRGATFATAFSSPAALLIRVGALSLDPSGRATAAAGFRAYARFTDGSERDFWRATVALAPAPSGTPSLRVTDPRNLIDASQFTLFALADGGTGARLAATAGADLLIPLDAAVLTGGPPGPFEVRIETRTDASAAVVPFDAHTRKRLTDRAGSLALVLRKGHVPSEIIAWVRAAARVLQSGGDLATIGVAAHLLRQGRAAAIDAARFDLARLVNRILRDVTGVSVRLPDLLAVRVVDDVPGLPPVRFEVAGDDSRTTDTLTVRVEVNGRPADAVVFEALPSVADGTSQGRVWWAFGTRRAEDVACAACPSDLGLTSGQNQIVITLSDARTGVIVGAADALVVLTTGQRPAALPLSIERPKRARRSGSAGSARASAKRGTRGTRARAARGRR
jgi:hypothetical protein